MRRFFSISILFLFLLIGSATSAIPPAVRIAVVSDVHFLDKQLALPGDALSAYELATGRNMEDLHAVLDIVFDSLQKEIPNVLLVTGDITNHGELQSHLGFIEKLQQLETMGIQTLVIPGNHDIQIPDAKAYRGSDVLPAATVTAQEFAQLYAPYGFADALSRDTASLSYLAAINESLWVLCFDTNRYAEHTTTSISSGRLHPQTMEWAIDILHKAKEQDVTVLGMMHHGLVEHMPYQAAFFSQYLVDDWEECADRLADAGLKVVFTGHFHANDISLRHTTSGNVLYDVLTASLAQYPFGYRMMTVSDSTLSIETRFVDTLHGKPNFVEDYQQKLEVLTRRVAKHKIQQMGIPMPNEALETLTELIVGLQLIHVKGDEVIDAKMMSLIQQFADQMGSDFDAEGVVFDFPPEDNNIVIPLRKKDSI